MVSDSEWSNVFFSSILDAFWDPFQTAAFSCWASCFTPKCLDHRAVSTSLSLLHVSLHTFYIWASHCWSLHAVSEDSNIRAQYSLHFHKPYSVKLPQRMWFIIANIKPSRVSMFYSSVLLFLHVGVECFHIQTPLIGSQCKHQILNMSSITS